MGDTSDLKNFVNKYWAMPIKGNSRPVTQSKLTSTGLKAPLNAGRKTANRVMLVRNKKIDEQIIILERSSKHRMSFPQFHPIVPIKQRIYGKREVSLHLLDSNESMPPSTQSITHHTSK